MLFALMVLQLHYYTASSLVIAPIRQRDVPLGFWPLLPLVFHSVYLNRSPSRLPKGISPLFLPLSVLFLSTLRLSSFGFIRADHDVIPHTFLVIFYFSFCLQFVCVPSLPTPSTGRTEKYLGCRQCPMSEGASCLLWWFTHQETQTQSYQHICVFTRPTCHFCFA